MLIIVAFAKSRGFGFELLDRCRISDLVHLFSGKCFCSIANLKTDQLTDNIYNKQEKHKLEEVRTNECKQIVWKLITY